MKETDLAHGARVALGGGAALKHTIDVDGGILRLLVPGRWAPRARTYRDCGEHVQLAENSGLALGVILGKVRCPRACEQDNLCQTEIPSPTRPLPLRSPHRNRPYLRLLVKIHKTRGAKLLVVVQEPNVRGASEGRDDPHLST
jgi:hypothetical protein